MSDLLSIAAILLTGATLVGLIVVACWLSSENRQLRGFISQLQAQVQWLRRAVISEQSKESSSKPAPTVAPRPTTIEPAKPVPASPSVTPPVAPIMSKPPDAVVLSRIADEPIKSLGADDSNDIYNSNEPESSSVSLEEMLGARLSVWIGAVTLAIAGAWFVKYSFERQLLSVEVRMVIAATFGVAMIGAAQWLYHRTQRIAAGLAGAGTAVLFVTVWASANMFNLFDPTLGFVIMAAITALAVVLSLRHGPFVALLGLFGGFATPALMSMGSHATGRLFGYLFVLQVGLLILTRWRGWRLLSSLTLLFGLCWAGYWILFNYQGGDDTWLALYLMGTAASFVIASTTPIAVTELDDAFDVHRVLSWIGVLGALGMMGVLTHVAGFGNQDWAYLGVLGAGSIVLTRLDSRYRALPWLAAGACAWLVVSWRQQAPDDPVSQTRMIWLTISYGLLYAGGGYACLFGAKRPREWADFSVVTAAGYLLIAYWGVNGVSDWRWAVACGVLAAMYAVGATPVFAKRSQLAYNEALAILCVGACAFVALAAPMALKRQWLAVAWALLIPMVAVIERQLRVPALRYVVLTLGALVAVRLLLNPQVLDYSIGQTPIINWLLYGYGVPILAFLSAACIYRFRWPQDADADDEASTTVQSAQAKLSRQIIITLLHVGVIAFSFALLTLEVRHFFARPNMDVGAPTLAQWASYVNIWLLLAMGLMWAPTSWLGEMQRVAGLVIGLAALVAAGAALCLVANPLVTEQNVGERIIFNGLLYAYGLPALLAAFSALQWRRAGQLVGAYIAGAGAVTLTFALISLQVRQAYHGADLQIGDMSNAESYTYSAVWGVYGLSLLIAGILTRYITLRWGSLIVAMLAVGKVFLFDTAHLQDLYRVFSFLGLGVTLMLLGYLYQKFVFSKQRESDKPI